MQYTSDAIYEYVYLGLQILTWYMQYTSDANTYKYIERLGTKFLRWGAPPVRNVSHAGQIDQIDQIDHLLID